MTARKNLTHFCQRDKHSAWLLNIKVAIEQNEWTITSINKQEIKAHAHPCATTQCDKITYT